VRLDPMLSRLMDRVFADAACGSEISVFVEDTEQRNNCVLARSMGLASAGRLRSSFIAPDDRSSASWRDFLESPRTAKMRDSARRNAWSSST